MAIGRLRLKKSGYDFPPYRPPSEARSLLLRVTRGCTWNKCTFCSMYRHIPFEKRPIDDIRSDIAAAAHHCREETETVFIADSNSLVVNTNTVIEILELLRSSFPNLHRITCYARAKTLSKKPLADLEHLRRAGLSRLHVGLETGHAGLLRDIRKGATPEDFLKAGEKARQAGLELSLYVLLGIGGQDLWREHAFATASVLSRIDPQFIRVRTLQPQPGSRIYENMKAGSFRKASHETVLLEQRLLIENLRVTSHYLSDHITNYVPVNGKLPEARQAMLATINDCLACYEHDPSLQRRFHRKDGIERL